MTITLTNTEDRSKNNKHDIEKANEKINKLETELQYIKDTLNTNSKMIQSDFEQQEIKINKIEENINEQTDRFLRITLIFTGIPFSHDTEKSWNDTKNTLITSLNKIIPSHVIKLLPDNL